MDVVEDYARRWIQREVDEDPELEYKRWLVSSVCIVARVLRYMRQCTAQEQLFCIYGNRQIIGQVYLLQVKSSLMRLRTIYLPTKGNKSVFGNIDLLPLSIV